MFLVYSEMANTTVTIKGKKNTKNRTFKSRAAFVTIVIIAFYVGIFVVF